MHKQHDILNQHFHHFFFVYNVFPFFSFGGVGGGAVDATPQ